MHGRSLSRSPLPMKLSIQLHNPEHEADAITQALCHTNIKVEVDDGRVVLATETLVPATFEVSNTALVYDAWQRINELIAIMNGAARVEGGALHEITLAGVAYEDGMGKWQHFPNVARMRAVGRALRATPPDPSELISVALSDKAAAKGLRLVSRDLDWCNLYRIFEVVADEVQESDIVRSRWATAAQINAFKCSANNESVTGDDSRHGGSRRGTSQNTMELADAQHMIKRILRGWLSSKAVQRSSSIA